MKIVLVVAINHMQHFQLQRHTNSPRDFFFNMCYCTSWVNLIKY